MEFYVVRDDGLGRRLKDAMLGRARAGVDVAFLYDEIGSADLFRLNFEVAAMVYDGPFAHQVEAMLERDLASCPAIDPASFADRPWHWRFGVRLARLMAPIL